VDATSSGMWLLQKPRTKYPVALFSLTGPPQKQPPPPTSPGRLNNAVIFINGNYCFEFSDLHVPLPGCPQVCPPEMWVTVEISKRPAYRTVVTERSPEKSFQVGGLVCLAKINDCNSE
jgi:hypothetical protein